MVSIAPASWISTSGNRISEPASVLVVVDLHDVIAAYVPQMIVKYGWPSNLEGWTLPQMFQHVDFVKHFEPENHAEFLLSLPIIEGAKEGLSQLSEICTDVVILTATRPNGPEEMATHRWLANHELDYLDIVFAGDALSKVWWIKEEAQKHTLIFVVDDHPVVLSQLDGPYGVKTVAFNVPWNYDVITDYGVRDWRQLLNLLVTRLPRETK